MKEIRKGNMIYIKNITKKREFIYLKVIYLIMIYVNYICFCMKILSYWNFFYQIIIKI
jgi:hypothetical protein